MKLFIFIIIFLTVLSGCTTIKMDMKTGILEYSKTRMPFEDQNIHGFTLDKSGDNLKITLDGSETKTIKLSELTEFFNSLPGN